ncbi:MAG: chemotaxis protein CheW [Polaromonas sp.]
MLDLQLDHAEAVQPAGPTNKLLAQGVQCGKYALAFSFDWARQIVDEFDLVPLPRAPSWVLGAVNVNGLIVPVVDVGNYFSEDSSPSQLQRGQRLLLGGVQAEDAEGALAIAFSQTPAQLEYEAQPLTDAAALPVRLQEVCKGFASTEQGQIYIEIDPQLLMNALAAELSII